MEQWAALVEWESGGLADVPSENMRYALNELLAEFAKRGDMPCDPVAWMDPSGKFEERAFSFSAETGWLPLMLMTPNGRNNRRAGIIGTSGLIDWFGGVSPAPTFEKG